MSEIPFVNQLGDAIETAIATPQPARRRLFRRRRRIGVLALAVLLLGATGSDGRARASSTPTRWPPAPSPATSRPDLSGDVTVLGHHHRVARRPPARRPGAADRRRPRWWPAPMAPAVAVIPRQRVARRARRAGLAALPGRLRRGAGARSRACGGTSRRSRRPRIASPRGGSPGARRPLLVRTGWTGWRTVLPDRRPRALRAHPPARRRRPELSLGGAVLPDVRRLEVKGGPPRSLDRRAVRRALARRSASWTPPASAATRSRGWRRSPGASIAVTGRTTRFKLGRLPADTGIESPRGRPLRRRAARSSSGAYPVYPAARRVVDVEVEIWRKGG